MFKKYLEINVIDAHILFGKYLPQFMYMDKQWSEDRVNSITYNNMNWEGFMVGYIYSGTVYKDIYILMKNHYKHSICHVFKKEEVIEDVAHHIAIGYLSDFEETINNELYDCVIEKWNYKMISKMLWYFWTYDDWLNRSEEKVNGNHEDTKKDIEKIRQNIIRFWDTFYNRYKSINTELLNDEDKKLISDSIKLIWVLENIDDNNVEKIRFAIPFVEYNYNSYYFIEKINKISSDIDTSEKRLIIGGLFLDLMKYIVPTYLQEEIIKFVKYLYDVKDEKVKKCADDICNIYAKHNIEFLRDIYLDNRDF